MNVAVLIPCLNPSQAVVEYVSSLMRLGMSNVIVVNDGSDAACDDVFADLAALPGCTVLSHEKNHGKGRALKTGFDHFLHFFSDMCGLVTAYADGRYRAEDVVAIAAALERTSCALVLGTRDTKNPALARFTRFGNRVASALLRILYGVRIADMQTGLRGYPSEFLERFLSVPGERYDYEINLLLSCVKYRLPIESLPVDSEYYQHHISVKHHIGSSLFTLLLLVQSFLRFAASSLTSSAVDIGLFAVMTKLVLSPFVPFYIELSTICARCVSASLNFCLNRKFVFSGRSAGKKAVGRFFLLTIFQMFASAVLVNALYDLTSIDEVVIKLFVDITLFFIGYQVQHRWIFSSKRD